MPDKIVDIIRSFLEFNRQNQEGQGLKILTTDQMISRLPISFAQLKAWNNSEKLENEIIVLKKTIIVFSVSFKRITKTIYNNLINTTSMKWKQFLWTLKIIKQMNIKDLD